MVVDLSYLQLFILTLLLVPILIVFKILEIDFSKKLIISIVRMFIQLSLIGIYLKYIFKWDNIIVNVLYTSLMILVASISCLKGTGIKLKGIWMIFIPIWIITMSLLVFFLGVIIKESGYKAQYFIPISGMILGNSLKTNIVSLNRFLWAVKEGRKEYEYSIVLGATKWEALLPHIKETVKLSIKPMIASTATIGLVSLPGMMTGQILGGGFPTVAIKYQIAIMIIIMAADFYCMLLILALVVKNIFDEYNMPKSEYLKGIS